MLNPSGLRDLRHALSAVDDDKIRRVVALMDRNAVPAAAQAILDPLRPRLAVLRPPRPLRFVRLLFLPFDPLIVQAPDWRPGDPTLPRSVLAPLGQVVHQALGQEADAIDRSISGRDMADQAAIALAGGTLWPRAAEVLAIAPAPADWDATGLPASVFVPLARAVAAVLQRAIPLRDIAGDATLGAIDPKDEALREILAGLPAESPEGFGMVVALLLVRLPFATMQLQRLIAAGHGSAESAKLRQAMDRGLDGVLSQMESPSGFDAEIRDAPLRDMGRTVQRIVALLRDIDGEPDTARHRPRLKTIRNKLDQACRNRFGTGLEEGLAAPLTASTEPIAAATQTEIETNTRALRTLELAARKIGDPAVYDALLKKAADMVHGAANAGVLTKVRKMRLIEILAGPEAAEALYRQGG